jgi:ribosomal protein S15P/S13E
MVAAAAPATAWSQELQAWGQALTDSLNAAWDRISREWQVNRHALQQESAGERLQLQTRITDLMTEMKTQSEHLSGQAQALTAASSLLREHLEAERRDLSEMLREQGLILIKYLEADGLEDGKLAALLELQHKLEAGLTQIAERDGLAALLQDIRRTLTALDPALNRLVEKPLEVEVHFVAGVPKVIRE